MAIGYEVHFVTKTHDFVDFFQVDFCKYICIKNKLQMTNDLFSTNTFTING